MCHWAGAEPIRHRWCQTFSLPPLVIPALTGKPERYGTNPAEKKKKKEPVVVIRVLASSPGLKPKYGSTLSAVQSASKPTRAWSALDRSSQFLQ